MTIPGFWGPLCNVQSQQRQLFILNVYLPYYSPENYYEYLQYIGKIQGLIEESDVMVVGDFNAQVGGACPFLHVGQSTHYRMHLEVHSIMSGLLHVKKWTWYFPMLKCWREVLIHTSIMHRFQERG